MGRHGGRTGRRDTLKGQPQSSGSGNRSFPVRNGSAASGTWGTASERPGAAVLTPPEGMFPGSIVGLNTPAGGLPDPGRWFEHPEPSPGAGSRHGSIGPHAIEPRYIEPRSVEPTVLETVRPPLPEIWWDDAPVPPPVVVAAADPGLVDDPRNVTAAFSTASRPGTRTATPAPRSRKERIARDGDRGPLGAGDETLTLPARRRLSDDDTSELVRPYVTGPIPLAGWAAGLDDRPDGPEQPASPRTPPADDWVVIGDPAEGWTVVDPGDGAASDDAARGGVARGGVPGDGKDARVLPLRRSTRERDVLAQRLGTHLTPPTGLTGLLGADLHDGSAGLPMREEQAGGLEDGAVSLFQPGGQASLGADSPWAAPAGGGLPSRRELRAEQRQNTSTRAVTARRLAKGGVLAVTAVGVVAAGGPAALSALGVDLHTPSSPLEQASLADAAVQAAAGPGALAGEIERATSDRVQPAIAEALRKRKVQDAVQAAKAGTAAATAGRTLVQVAAEQVRLEAERKEKLAQQVSRNVIRDPRSYARMLVTQRGWSSGQFSCLNLLWNRESGWNYRASNPSSGAYGIPQALPGSKMGSVASDWRTNPATQIKWGLNYISQRYGTPCGAWSHSERVGWY